MNESPKFEFDGGIYRKYVIKDGATVGSIDAIYGEGSTVTGYSIFSFSLDQTVNSSCKNMNQAKAYAEHYFSKEVPS